MCVRSEAEWCWKHCRRSAYSFDGLTLTTLKPIRGKCNRSPPTRAFLPALPTASGELGSITTSSGLNANNIPMVGSLKPVSSGMTFTSSPTSSPFLASSLVCNCVEVGSKGTSSLLALAASLDMRSSTPCSSPFSILVS